MIGLNSMSRWADWLSKGVNWRGAVNRIASVPRNARIQDTITIGLVSGLIGTLVMDLSNRLFHRARLTERTYAELAASVIVRPFRTRQPKNAVLGQILHMITGSAAGLPLVYMLKKTGPDLYLIKGAAMGTVLWGVLYDFGRKVGLISVKPRKTQSHYFELWHNLLYGLATSQAIVSLADPKILNPKTQPQSTMSVEGEYSQTIVPGGEQHRRRWRSLVHGADYADPPVHGTDRTSLSTDQSGATNQESSYN